MIHLSRKRSVGSLGNPLPVGKRKSKRKPGRVVRRKVVGLTLGLVATIPVFGFGPATHLPRADAAFPGRNGRIAISVIRPPFNSLPEVGVPIFAGERDIFTFSSDGAAIHQLTSGPEADVQPAWSPDGRKVVFLRTDIVFGRAFSSDVYVINADGSGLRNLTNSPSVYEFQPSWSPDGSRIVFSSDRANPDLRWRVSQLTEPEQDLYVMDADGGNVTQITSDPGFESHPSWSPDGDWIAIMRHTWLALVSPDGSRRTVLVRNLGVQAPQWSPDGNSITFGAGDGIWIINRDGGGLRRITFGDESRSRFPTWSPDGRFIAFISDRDGAWKLYKMRADGSGVQLLVDIDLQSPISSADWGPSP